MGVWTHWMHNFWILNVFCRLYEHLLDGGHIDRQVPEHQEAHDRSQHEAAHSHAGAARVCAHRLVLELNAAVRLVALCARADQDVVLGRVDRALARRQQLQYGHVPLRVRHTARYHCGLQRQNSRLSQYFAHQDRRLQVQVQAAEWNAHRIGHDVERQEQKVSNGKDPWPDHTDSCHNGPLRS